MNNMNTTLDKLNYVGTIKVMVKKGNKICEQKEYKNSGRWPLFYFISNCLAGNYLVAEKYRPKYISLFSVPVEEGSLIPIISEVEDNQTADAVSLTDYATTANKINLITFSYNDDPKTEKIENNIGQSSVTYSFSIPFTYLKSDGNNSMKPINLVCLYSANSYAEPTNPSAFFFVPKEKGSNELGELVTIKNEYIEKQQEYNLFIEWKLTINN